MDFVNDTLTAHSKNRSLSPAIKASLGLGKQTLNQYYSLTDSSEVYQIAMVLHPRYKLQYFKDASWEDNWIDTVNELVCGAFEGSYKHHGASNNVEPSSPPKKALLSKPKNIFDSLPSLNAPVPKKFLDELEHYLNTDAKAVDNVLMWWSERQGMYPCLSHMALDYLLIPGMFFIFPTVKHLFSNLLIATSVDIERTFSHGRLILSHVRSHLSAQST
jgi:hypothetical protein